MTKWLWETFKNRKCGRPQNRSGAKYNKFGVLHTTENNLGASAKDVALWQNTQKKVYSGYHYLIDVDGVVYQCNPRTTKAQHAGLSYRWGGALGGGNNGIGASMVARAGLMPYSSEQGMFDNLLNNTAGLLVDINEEYGIPIKKITIEQYKNGVAGWLGHQDVAYRIDKAGRKKQRKFDPGARFPWDVLISRALSIQKLRENKMKTTNQDVTSHPADSVDFGTEVMSQLKSVGATANSLKYSLLFYREVAKRVGVDGSI